MDWKKVIKRQLELLAIIASVLTYTVVAGAGLITLSDSQRAVESVLENSRRCVR